MDVRNTLENTMSSSPVFTSTLDFFETVHREAESSIQNCWRRRAWRTQHGSINEAGFTRLSWGYRELQPFAGFEVKTAAERR